MNNLALMSLPTGPFILLDFEFFPQETQKQKWQYNTLIRIRSVNKHLKLRVCPNFTVRRT